ADAASRRPYERGRDRRGVPRAGLGGQVEAARRRVECRADREGARDPEEGPSRPRGPVGRRELATACADLRAVVALVEQIQAPRTAGGRWPYMQGTGWR